MKRLGIVFLVVTLALIMSLPTAFAYTGSLSTDDGGLIGTGAWASGSSLSWEVTQNQDNSWHYSYFFDVSEKSVSHMILETSYAFTIDDIFNIMFDSGTYGSLEIGENGMTPGNPNIPDAIYGIKFDETDGLSMQFSFDSWRTPVWGDFYAKDGVDGGVTVSLWNAGFTPGDTDPLDPPADGSIGYHILRPDTVVPEPGSIMALGSGVLMLGAFLRRKRS